MLAFVTIFVFVKNKDFYENTIFYDTNYIIERKIEVYFRFETQNKTKTKTKNVNSSRK